MVQKRVTDSEMPFRKFFLKAVITRLVYKKQYASASGTIPLRPDRLKYRVAEFFRILIRADTAAYPEHFRFCYGSVFLHAAYLPFPLLYTEGTISFNAVSTVRNPVPAWYSDSIRAVGEDGKTKSENEADFVL